jgi:hypothetical protein
MGVLLDGTPYLTASGLSRMCGVDHSTMSRMVSDWSIEKKKPRGRKLTELLAMHGYHKADLHVDTEWNGSRVLALNDSVCVAILQYYAFEVGKKKAQHAFALLARQTLRQFIYQHVGYNPESRLPRCWDYYHDRIFLNRPPAGYFTAFNETAEMVLTTIREGLQVDTHTVPDISIGQTWRRYWEEEKLEEQFGEPKKLSHRYPGYYHQSMVSSVQAWAYPDAALPSFRQWLRDVYLPKKFPAYVKKKVKQGVLPAERVESLMAGAEAHVGEKPALVGAPKTVHPSLPERSRRPGGERVS